MKLCEYCFDDLENDYPFEYCFPCRLFLLGVEKTRSESIRLKGTIMNKHKHKSK